MLGRGYVIITLSSIISRNWIKRWSMLKHQFGIMMTDPASEQIFEEYEPDKYDCIAVDDEYVQAVAEKLARVSVYWHGLDRPESGWRIMGSL